MKTITGLCKIKATQTKIETPIEIGEGVGREKDTAKRTEISQKDMEITQTRIVGEEMNRVEIDMATIGADKKIEDRSIQ